MTEVIVNDGDLVGLKGKVVIVTGGSSGIGLATIDLLLSLGASVVGGDVSAPAEAPASNFTFVKTDVGNWAQLNALFRKAKETYGRIDHVFANAGLGPRADYLATEVDANGDLKEPSWELMDVNLKGVMNTATLAVFYQRQQAEGGSIVINASTMSIQRCRALDYATAKHAVLGFSRGMHPLLNAANLPIRINSVCPTWTDTQILPGLRQIFDAIKVEAQPTSAVARAAVLLMADESRKGQAIQCQQGKFKEIDEALLLPMAADIRGPDYPAEDEVLERAFAWIATQQASA